MRASSDTHKTVRLRFRNPGYNRIIRQNTESIATNMGFDTNQIFDISLAVEEAYANAIEHGGGLHAELELEVLYQLYDDRLEVSVQDTGCGFEISTLETHQNPCLEDRGRGLRIIQSLADSAEILSLPGVGTLIRIIKYLSPRVETEQENQ